MVPKADPMEAQTLQEAAQRVAAMELKLHEKGEELEIAKEKAMVFVQELLLEKRRLQKALEEAEEGEARAMEELGEIEAVRSKLEASEAARDAALSEAELARADTAKAQVEAAQAGALAQELKNAVGGLQAELQAKCDDELTALRSRCTELEAQLEATAEEQREAQAAAQAAEEREQIAAAKTRAAREEAAASAALLAERDAALVAAEEALALLAPDVVAEAQVGGSLDEVPLTPKQAIAEGEMLQTAVSLAPPVVLSPPPPQGNGEAQAPASDGDDAPLAELIAEWTINGAQSDSVLTNPALGISAVIDYVNEWRDALQVKNLFPTSAAFKS